MSEDDTTIAALFFTLAAVDPHPLILREGDTRPVVQAFGEPFRGSMAAAMGNPAPLKNMADAELEELEDQVRRERESRRCPDFLPGHQSCDQGSAPHDVHGYIRWGSGTRHDRQIRVEWRYLP